MKSLKITLSALLLGLSLSAYAQDEEEVLDAPAEDDVEVFVPTTPTQKKFFQRVQVGYTGTIARYSNFGRSYTYYDQGQKLTKTRDHNDYFLHGISVGWMGDLRIAKKIDLYLELGANFTYHFGKSKADSILTYPASQGGDEHVHSYKVNAFSITIPVSISKHFKNAFGVEDFTIAPFAGVYARFNLMAKRKETEKVTYYNYNPDGTREVRYTADGNPMVECYKYSASLMKIDSDKRAIIDKPHTGRLLQCGAQAGVNLFYKNYSLGIAYMRDLMPFAGHVSSKELTHKTTAQNGYLPTIGTNCDEKISTDNNFMVTVGYVF